MALSCDVVNAALDSISTRATSRNPECLFSLRIVMNSFGGCAIDGFWNGGYLNAKVDSLGMAITVIQAIIGYSDGCDLARHLNTSDKGE